MSVLVPATAHAQRVPDWKAVEAEAISTIQSYVRINTSNPPGDVTKAADFLVAILEREGVPVKRYESAPGQSIVLARLKGTGPQSRCCSFITWTSCRPIHRAGPTTLSVRRSPTAESGAVAHST